MTMSDPLVLPPRGRVWTIDDLTQLTDDGNRYELVDGSLLVSPHANIRHGSVANRLRDRLSVQAPPEFCVGQDIGVNIHARRTYYVPDIFVVHEAALGRDGACFEPDEVLLVVEVLSKDNKSHDVVLKRHDYAKAGIQQYWIVDPDARTLMVLGDITQRSYRLLAEVRPGEEWASEHPFPLRLDPAQFC